MCLVLLPIALIFYNILLLGFWISAFFLNKYLWRCLLNFHFPNMTCVILGAPAIRYFEHNLKILTYALPCFFTIPRKTWRVRGICFKTVGAVSRYSSIFCWLKSKSILFLYYFQPIKYRTVKTGVCESGKKAYYSNQLTKWPHLISMENWMRKNAGIANILKFSTSISKSMAIFSEKTSFNKYKFFFIGSV